MIDTKWVRYRHKERHIQREWGAEKPAIEYDVESVNLQHLRGYKGPTVTDPTEECVKIRTIRNLLYEEEVHQPAYTYMPIAQFTDVYEMV